MHETDALPWLMQHGVTMWWIALVVGSTTLLGTLLYRTVRLAARRSAWELAESLADGAIGGVSADDVGKVVVLAGVIRPIRAGAALGLVVGQTSIELVPPWRLITGSTEDFRTGTNPRLSVVDGDNVVAYGTLATTEAGYRQPPTLLLTPKSSDEAIQLACIRRARPRFAAAYRTTRVLALLALAWAGSSAIAGAISLALPEFSLRRANLAVLSPLTRRAGLVRLDARKDASTDLAFRIALRREVKGCEPAVGMLLGQGQYDRALTVAKGCRMLPVSTHIRLQYYLGEFEQASHLAEESSEKAAWEKHWLLYVRIHVLAGRNGVAVAAINRRRQPPVATRRGRATLACLQTMLSWLATNRTALLVPPANKPLLACCCCSPGPPLVLRPTPPGCLENLDLRSSVGRLKRAIHSLKLGLRGEGTHDLQAQPHRANDSLHGRLAALLQGVKQARVLRNETQLESLRSIAARYIHALAPNSALIGAALLESGVKSSSGDAVQLASERRDSASQQRLQPPSSKRGLSLCTTDRQRLRRRLLLASRRA